MAIVIPAIEEAAPDQASLDAALELLQRPRWPVLEVDADGSVLWGQCQGSGATPYSVAVAAHDLGAKCTCPSRKFPCKHALALMWWMARSPQAFATGDPPQWVGDWLSRRRGNAPPPAREKAQRPSARSAAQARDEAVAQAPAAAARAARQRERNREARERAILEGLDQLDLWIADQLEQGLAGFDTRAQAQCATVTRRLIDAKAPGLANAVDNLVARYFGSGDVARDDVLIEALGLLHLLGEAYRRQADLPAALRADVRQAVGWHVEREPLLADAGADRRAGRWLVVAIRREVQPDRLLRRETWLAGTGARDGEHAVLLDFVPVAAAGSEGGFTPGQVLDADLVFYPSSTPLRALVGAQRVTVDGGEPEWPGAACTLAGALDGYTQRLTINPWLPPWPLAFAGARVRRASDGRLWVTDAEERHALPVSEEQRDGAALLLGLEAIVVHGLFDGHAFSPLAAATAIGPWWGEAA